MYVHIPGICIQQVLHVLKVLAEYSTTNIKNVLMISCVITWIGTYSTSTGKHSYSTSSAKIKVVPLLPEQNVKEKDSTSAWRPPAGDWVCVSLLCVSIRVVVTVEHSEDDILKAVSCIRQAALTILDWGREEGSRYTGETDRHWGAMRQLDHSFSSSYSSFSASSFSSSISFSTTSPLFLLFPLFFLLSLPLMTSTKCLQQIVLYFNFLYLFLHHRFAFFLNSYLKLNIDLCVPSAAATDVWMTLTPRDSPPSSLTAVRASVVF